MLFWPEISGLEDFAGEDLSGTSRERNWLKLSALHSAHHSKALGGTLMKSIKRRISGILAVLLICVFSLSAQFDSAAVLGVVRDATSASLSNAKVTIVNTKTGIEQIASSDGSGNYQFQNIPIGTYRVSAEAPGFKKAVVSEFTVTVNARQRVDLTLQVGDVAEQIVVTDAATPLETETSSRGTVVNATQIVNLPLNGRNYVDLALLAPGVRKSAIATSRDASFNVNGMRSSLNNFVIDGVDNNAYGTSNQGFSNQVVQLSPDAVQEFRIETTNYSAELTSRRRGDQCHDSERHQLISWSGLGVSS
ncbi:MAG: carboxypeptidase regulatory-like domain-containing protein [Bryobacteraceae bacterium]